MKRYTEQHEWVLVEDDIAIVGISAHAAKELGDITFVELPELEDEVAQGEQLAVVESVKAAADVYSPISGVVSEVNEDLEDAPEIVNDSPEDDGWICKLTDIDKNELESLMDEAAYIDFCN